MAIYLIPFRLHGMKTWVFFTLIMLISSVHCKASPHDSSKHFFVSEIFISGSAYGQGNPKGSLENFRTLAPASGMLMQNFIGYSLYSSNYDQGAGNPMLMLGLGFKSNHRKNGPTYRLGLGYGNGTGMEGQYTRDNKFRIDTFTSSRTGQKIYIDSSVSETYSFDHFASLLKLDISVVWRTSTNRKMKLFAGIGCLAGTSLYAVTTIEYYKSSYVNAPFIANYNRYHTNLHTTETYHQKNQTSAAIYCPFGLDYQISKKSRFWKTLNIFMESRVQIFYKNIPELGHSIRSGIQIGFGIRKSFNPKI